ncbi:MAG: hypothetical protein IT260_13625 [Saprospiraceae bacterium]|nr:hypothetical protein [Saprospiraceae bacterium]
MKKGLLSLLFLSLALAVSAQANDKFVKAMEKALAGLDSMKTPEQWLAKSNMFERIAQKEPGEWLPVYYVGLCQSMIFNLDQDVSKHEPLCDKADKFLALADSLNPNNSEVYVLRSMAAGMRIRLNPMVNGQKYGPLSGMLIDKALQLDPENPRAYMQKGIGIYFTPPQWGGSPEKGKELMETAAQKFDTFKPASSIHPAWGKSANAYILDMAKGK